MKKRANVTYINEMINKARGTEFVCIGGGDLFGRMARVNETGFMQVVWADTGEDVENDPVAKHYPFIQRIS
ncbi:hypothetical protein A616_17240 [Brevibacillus brevis X23]|nr:hypothetical protein A616_17240 [Brevibacillus brevis X23]